MSFENLLSPALLFRRNPLRSNLNTRQQSTPSPNLFLDQRNATQYLYTALSWRSYHSAHGTHQNTPLIELRAAPPHAGKPLRGFHQKLSLRPGRNVIQAVCERGIPFGQPRATTTGNPRVKAMTTPQRCEKQSQSARTHGQSIIRNAAAKSLATCASMIGGVLYL